MYKSFLLSILFILLLSSCSEQKQNHDKKAPRAVSERPVSNEDLREVANATLKPEIEKYILKLDSVYDTVPYYSRLNDQYIFYVCKGEWKFENDQKFNADKSFLLGIVDEAQQVLLPVEYTKIYNPDGTIPGYIEIEKNKKIGLFNYKNRKIITPQFDVIFPSHKSEYDGFGKMGDDYYSIKDTVVEKYAGDIPTYIAMGEQWNYDIKSNNIHYLYDSYISYADGNPIEGSGVVFTPSYFYRLGFLPEIANNIGDGKEEYISLIATKGQVVKTVSITDKIAMLISSFYEEGSDARGWMISRKNIITVDSKNNVLHSEKILDQYDEYRISYCEDKSGFNYLGHNILEVSQIKSPENIYLPYDNMTLYTYYQIQENGEVEKLYSPRFFDFTKYIEIDENYFKGCFSKYSEETIEMNGQEGNVWLYDHLTLADLDLMTNEIYAEYGLKFKTEKWKQYFSKQPGYTPLHDNVDHLLSETDKKNIQVIVSAKEKMKGREDQFTNKRAVYYEPGP